MKSTDIVEVPYSELKDTENVCYQNAIETQTINKESIDDSFFIDLSECNSSFTEQDQLDFQTSIASALNDFFIRHNIETPDGIIQVINSMTYGDMVICFLLFAILLVMVLKWFWEVLRW